MFSLPVFTLIHVVISILGIISGLVAVGGLIAGVRLGGWIALFLLTTILTDVTGYGFPFTAILPSHIVGAISLVALAIAVAAIYAKRLAGGWRTTFVVTSVFALWANTFVLMAQLMGKVPAIATIAPGPNAPAFGATQLLVVVIFVVTGWIAVKGFRTERRTGSL
jgi:hypothetical protein